MKSLLAAVLSSSALFCTSTLAAPTPESAAAKAVTDVDILQFALTLENLENAFYRQALAKFNSNDFDEAGCPSDYYTNLEYIASDEASHVQLISQAITAAGRNPVKPCTYQFNLTDAKSFVALSSVLEGVGTSAYLGGAPLIQSKSYLTVAGSILVTEALHTSLQRLEAGEVPFANAYGTPLGANEVYTLAAAFIKNCPASNPPLPFKAFPALALAGSSDICAAGDQVCFNKPRGTVPANTYITFLSGLSVEPVKTRTVNGNLCALVPPGASGQTYALLTKTAATTISDANVIAGPAILEVQPQPPTVA